MKELFDISPEQERMDAFYWSTGPCCAGCDWWRHVNSFSGECTKSAPVSALERFGMLGLAGASVTAQAGHIMTPRNHTCGDFQDTFDWRVLPPRYLKRIGYVSKRITP